MLSRWKKECWFWITEIIWARSHKSKSEIALQRWWPHRSYKSSDEQHPGFARGHPPYYWPGSKEFNFRDQTRAGAVSVIWPFMSIPSIMQYLYCVHMSIFNTPLSYHLVTVSEVLSEVLPWRFKYSYYYYQLSL